MYAASMKSNKKNNSMAAAYNVSKKQSSRAYERQFVDNRAVAIAQKKMQESINNSSRAKRIRAFQENINTYPVAAIQKENLDGKQQLQGKFEPVQKKETDKREFNSRNTHSQVEKSNLWNKSNNKRENKDNTYSFGGHEEIIQRTFIGGLLGGVAGGIAGGIAGGALGLVATALTIGSGGLALPLVGAIGGLIGGATLGHYETNSSQVVNPNEKSVGVKDVSVKLYYSPSLLGHFTIIINREEEVRRIHMVMKEERGQTKLERKAKQVGGCAKGQYLMDVEGEQNQFSEKYGDEKNRPLVGEWNISAVDAEKMIGYVEEIKKSANPNYGYIIYSSNVDNCGSGVIKILAQAGISVTLPRWKQWLQLPSLVKGDIQDKSKME